MPLVELADIDETRRFRICHRNYVLSVKSLGLLGRDEVEDCSLFGVATVYSRNHRVECHGVDTARGLDYDLRLSGNVVCYGSDYHISVTCKAGLTECVDHGGLGIVIGLDVVNHFLDRLQSFSLVYEFRMPRAVRNRRTDCVT